MLGELTGTQPIMDSRMQIIIYACAAAIIIGIIIYYFERKITAPFISRLIKENRNSKETSISVKEMKMDGFFLKLALLNSSINRVIDFCTKDERDGKETDNKKAPPISQRCFYIKEENATKANALYAEKKLSIVTVIVSIVVIGFAAFLIVKYLPSFLNFVKSFLPGSQK